ncbi:MAG: hypothetical protein EOO19_12690, partial [Chryseobacterium sp.]
MKRLTSKNQTKSSLKYLALIPLFMVACKKDPEVKDTKVDTVTTVEKPIDTLSAIIKTERESNQKIITVDASKMPIRLNLEIKNPNDQIILKLENLNQPKIKGYVKTESPMNVRINQIRMPCWSRGRVTLVGDAGYCVSPLAGFGGSMAIIGAGRLADALERYPDDHGAA